MAIAVGLLVGTAVVVGEVMVRRARPELTRAAQLESLGRLRSKSSWPDARFHHVGTGIFAPEFPPAGASRPRVLIVGDSFAMGHGVGVDGRFGARLQDRLGAAVHVDVLAASSYAPVIYRNLVDDALRANEYATLAVFVDQTDPVDELIYRDDLTAPEARQFDVARMQQRNREIDVVRDAIRGELAAWPRTSALVNFLWPLRSVGERLPDGSTARTLQLALSYPLLMYAFEREPDRRMTQTMETLLVARLDDIVAAAARSGVPVLLAANPWEQQVAAAPRDGPFGPGPYPVSNRLERVLAERYADRPGVAVLPLTDAFRAHPHPESLYLATRGEVHWNADGHVLVADTLGRALELGVLSSSDTRTGSP